MSWRFAAARLASPEKESNSMIEFQSTAITCGLDPLRTPPAPSFIIPSRRPIPLLWHLELPDPEGRCLPP
ncbi:MAG: hypothetical protein JO114_04240 [Planctomycetaceae bacterium]|nr:hypothetical protein [Planctomycetaceae bacterium]